MDESIYRRLIEQRQGLKEALSYFLEGYNIILIAPTGYGKTILSRILLEEAIKNNLSAGLIHVAPFRALVREMYMEKFKGIENAGWQMHGELVSEDKSPYYLRKLVVTTLDSFVYNLYRIPVAEMRKILEGKTSGHYYPVLASIYTSTIIFDEAHFYLDDSHSCNGECESTRALIAALEYLSYLRIPLVIMTATMKSDLIYEIAELMSRNQRGVKVIYVGSVQIQELRSKLQDLVLEVKDRYFTEKESFEWKTVIIKESDAFDKASELCSSETVLLIRNTVKRAVETYEMLKNKCDKIVLLHGLLSDEDRKNALENAKKMLKEWKEGVIVATQVVEAGVEIGGRVLITDMAPVENIAQRAGRLCREAHGYNVECEDEGAYVYIVKNKTTTPYQSKRVEESTLRILEILNSGKNIDWRLLEERDNYVSYAKLVEMVGSSDRMRKRDSSVLRLYLESDADPNELIKLLNSYGLRLLDRSYLLVLAIPRNKDLIDKLRKEGLLLDNYDSFNEMFETVTVDAERLFLHEIKQIDFGHVCLEYVDHKPLLLLVYPEKAGIKLVTIVARGELKKITRAIQSTQSVTSDPTIKLLAPCNNNISASYVYLLANPDCYVKGLGLRIW